MTPVGVFFICQNEDKCHFVNSTILSRSWLFAVLPLPGYSFSDGHLVFKVQLIDELP